MSWLKQAKNAPILAIARDLGLPVRRSGIQCPSCRATRRSKTDRRPLSATFGAGGGWRCHRSDCGASGDISDLVAYRLTGERLGNDARQLAEVSGWLADRGYVQIDTDSDTARAALRALPPPPPDPSKRWPDQREVLAVWNAARPVTADPAILAWMMQRYGSHADRLVRLVDHLSAARALSPGAAPSWARFGGRSWYEGGYRLIFPLCDAGGQIRSVRARRIRQQPTPKAIPAAGHGCAGLVLGCDRARALLSGAPLPGKWPAGRAPRVVVVEGETDWLTWLSRRRTLTDPALIGVYSGAWLPAHSAALPPASIVIVRTDDNDAGHRYAEAIARASNSRRDLSIIRAGVL